MAIRWIKHVMIDGQKQTLEIQMGDRFIGDKAYTRIGKETEKWFKCKADTRDGVLAEGLGVLRGRLSGKRVMGLDNSPFDWQP